MIGNFLSGEACNFRHVFLETCISTNQSCFEISGQGEPGNLWITAAVQTGGKGSRGREWTSSNGNLFASLLLRNPCEKSRLAELTFVAAVSVHNTLAGITGSGNVKLKWPNDVLVNGKKCGGILLESRLAGDDLVVVAGIGINCQSFPEKANYPATSLFHEGHDADAPAVFAALADWFSRNLALWDKGNNFAEIREKWIESSIGMGEQVTVRIPGQEDISGVFASIDKAGYMLVEMASGETRRISTADVFFNQSVTE